MNIEQEKMQVWSFFVIPTVIIGVYSCVTIGVPGVINKIRVTNAAYVRTVIKEYQTE